MNRRSFFQTALGGFVTALATTWRSVPTVADISRATNAFWQNRNEPHEWDSMRDEMRRVYKDCRNHDKWFDIHTGEVY
jgi:hypothetical protein